jgi:hypothetical protein
MHPNRAYWQLLLPIMMFGLTGCAGFELRKGPSPVIDGTAVYAASDNKLVLLGALERDAGLDQGPAPPDYYYQVAEAGFNYVDDQCRSYFDELFFLNKGREQVKSGLAATGQTTLAILGITGAAVPTLTIVAQAFGLASAATDIVTGTYLYALPPATTQSFVERLQLAFRAQASGSSASVRSPAAAYYLIQRYLNLCLPPTIEAEITKQISNTNVVGQPVTNAVGQPVGGGEFFSLATFSNAPPPPKAQFSGRPPVTLLPSSRTPLQHTLPQQTTSLPKGILNSYEASLSRSSFKIREIQSTVCVKNPDGELGPVGSVTRKNIVEFFDQFPNPRASINANGGGLTPKAFEILEKAHNAYPEGCLASGFKSPADIGKSQN